MKFLEKKWLTGILLIGLTGLALILLIWWWYGRQLDRLDKKIETSKNYTKK